MNRTALRNVFGLCKKFSTSAAVRAEQEVLSETALCEFHVGKGARMVPFAGWSMPLQYQDLSIKESHHHTRHKASVFDVSHMLQFKIHGSDRVKFIEELVVADVAATAVNTGGLSLFMNDRGGIIDDTIINNAGDHLYVVSNAGCAFKIKPHVEAHEASWKKKGDVAVEFLEGLSLLALQGPKAAEALQAGTNLQLDGLKFMDGRDGELFGVPECRITRCGYTGEDGFELRIPSSRVAEVAENLLENEDVKLAGLGARDSLRLEAGLCLYGNDIDEDTTPVEAALLWTIAKRRRTAADFPGAEIVLKQIKDKPTRKRVGLVSTGPPPRSHTPVLNKEGEAIGEVTSGVPSPSIGKNIAMAYVPLALSKIGTELQLQRGKKLSKATVVKMPFHPTKYVF